MSERQQSSNCLLYTSESAHRCSSGSCTGFIHHCGFQSHLIKAEWHKHTSGACKNAHFLRPTLRSSPLISLCYSSRMHIFASPWSFWSPYPVESGSRLPQRPPHSVWPQACGIRGSLASVWEWLEEGINGHLKSSPQEQFVVLKPESLLGFSAPRLKE